MIKNWWCDATWEMRNKCVSYNVTIIGLTICFFMLHNPHKSKKWYLSMHRLAHSLTNQSCGPLLIWNGTLFSKMAPWCGQVRGHSLWQKILSNPWPTYQILMISDNVEFVRSFWKWWPVKFFQCWDIIIYPHIKFWWYRIMLNFYRPFFMPCFGSHFENFMFLSLSI